MSNDACPLASLCMACTSSTNCLMPVSFARIISGGGVVCEDGYVEADTIRGVCTRCDPSCKTCSASSTWCTSCNSGLSLDSAAGICICPSGYTVNIYTGLCKSCHLTCATCEGGLQTECKTCFATFIFKPNAVDSNIGSCACPGQYYRDVTTTPISCKACHPTCAICTGPTNNDCFSCKGVGVLQRDRTCGCRQGSYMNTANGFCVLCHLTCRTCIGPNSNDCLSCYQGNYDSVARTCSCTFPTLAGYLRHSSNPYCSTPHPSCLTAQYNSNLPIHCLTCRANAHLSNGMCICNDGYYMDSSFICKPCPSFCKTCISGSNIGCIEVQPTSLSTVIHPKSGVRFCTDIAKVTTAAGECASTCHSSCNGCIDTGPSKCTLCREPGLTMVNGICQCQDGYYRVTDDCFPCHISCLTCTGPNSDNCLTCRPNENLIVVGPAISCVCDEVYMTRSTSNPQYCVSKFTCAPECYVCFIPDHLSVCKSCFENAIISETTCVCQPGFGMNSQKRCEPCNLRCETCDLENKDICLTCRLLNTLPTPNPTCACSPGFYFQNTTNQCDGVCHAQCKSCVGPGHLQCTSCYDGSTPVRGYCGCPEGQSITNTSLSVCSPCSPTCKSCRGTNVCTSCKTNAILVGSTCICIINYYQDAATGDCIPVQCDSSCLSCKSSLPTGCVTCKPNAYIFQGRCFCFEGYLQDLSSGDCVPCSGCLTCSQSPTHCSSCLPSASLSSNTCHCDIDETLQPNGGCNIGVGCSFECNSCNPTYPSICYLCKGPNMIYNPATFKCTCPSGYYILAPTGCVPCHYSCLECIGKGSTECTSCGADQQLFGSPTGECRSLSANQYINNDGVSTTCHQTCATCFDYGPNSCLSCNAGSTLNSSQCTCNRGTYYDLSSLSCHTPICHYSCGSCHGYYSDQCLSCKSASAVLKSGICECLAGNFMDLSEDCLACHSSCLTCVGPLPSDCVTCHLNYVLDDQGYCNCPQDTDILNSCLPNKSCHASCKTCSGPLKNNCLTCFDGSLLTSLGTCLCKESFYLDTITSKCMPCYSLCKSCKGPSVNDCTLCDPSKLLFLEQSTCLCDSKHSLQLQPEVRCNPQLCPFECGTCTGGLACLTCSTSRLLTSAGICECRVNTYPIIVAQTQSPSAQNPQYDCLICHPTCATCTGPGSNECTTCNSNAVLVSQMTCYCIRGYYFDGTISSCSACHSSCFTCRGPLSTECLSCRDGYAFSLLPTGFGSCQLQPSFTLITNVNGGIQAIDLNCHPTCLTCTSSSSLSCLTCRKLANLQSDNSCLCPLGMKSDLITGECMTIACSPTCLTCDSSSPLHCSSCRANQSLAAYPLSYCECIVGYFKDSEGNCLPCHPTCKTCTNSSLSGCKDCHLGMTKVADGSCQCPFSYGMDLVTKQCQPCHMTCRNCHTTQPESCFSCKSGHQKLLNGACKCWPGYRLTPKGTCSLPSCDYRCETCYGSADTNCLSCRYGAYLDDLHTTCSCQNGLITLDYDGDCEACHPTCATCEGATSTNCKTCFPLSSLQADSSCVCIEGFYFDFTVGGGCLSCHPSCLKCSGPRSNECIECRIDALLTTTNECRCNNNLPMKPDGSCNLCSVVCKTCSALGKCASCYENAHLDNDGGCMCDQSYYFEVNNRCHPCHTSCLNCRGPTSQDCILCHEGSRLDFTTNKCVCKYGAFYDLTRNACIDCPIQNNCFTCIDSQFCTACKDGYSFDDQRICRSNEPSSEFSIRAHVFQDQLFVYLDKEKDPTWESDKLQYIKNIVESSGFAVIINKIITVKNIIENQLDHTNSHPTRFLTQTKSLEPLSGITLTMVHNSIYEWKRGLLRFTITHHQDIHPCNTSITLFTSSTPSPSPLSSPPFPYPSHSFHPPSSLSPLSSIFTLQSSLFTLVQLYLIVVRPSIGTIRNNPVYIWIGQSVLWHQIIGLGGYCATELRGWADTVSRNAAKQATGVFGYGMDVLGPAYLLIDKEVLHQTRNSYYLGKVTSATSSVPLTLHGLFLPSLLYLTLWLLSLLTTTSTLNGPITSLRAGTLLSFLEQYAYSFGHHLAAIIAGYPSNMYTVCSFTLSCVVMMAVVGEIIQHKRLLLKTQINGDMLFSEGDKGIYAFDLFRRETLSDRDMPSRNSALRRVIIDEIDIILLSSILQSSLSLYPLLQSILQSTLSLILLPLSIDEQSAPTIIHRSMYLFYCLSNVFMAVRLYPDIPVRIVNILQWLYIGGYGMLNIMNVVCLGARIWRDIRGARIRFEKEIDIKEENLEIKNKVDKPVGEEVARFFDLSTSFAYNNKSTNIPKSATATELAKPRYSQLLLLLIILNIKFCRGK
jgi:hypothetical protein